MIGVNIRGTVHYYEDPNVFSISLELWFCLMSSRSSDCFSLGWPMRDDGDFFKSTRDMKQVLLYHSSCYSF